MNLGSRMFLTQYPQTPDLTVWNSSIAHKKDRNKKDKSHIFKIHPKKVIYVVF